MNRMILNDRVSTARGNEVKANEVHYIAGQSRIIECTSVECSTLFLVVVEYGII